MNATTLDQAVATLQAHKNEWARLPIERKLDYLEALRTQITAVASRWVDVASQIKHIPADSPYIGEEWISGPWTMLHNLNGFNRTLGAIKRGHPPRLNPDALRTRPDGQLIVNVFPETFYDRLLLNSYHAEIWMQPGVTRDTLYDTMGTFYQQGLPDGAVVVVLAAGNITSIAPLDILYRLFAMGHVGLLKVSPLNEPLTPVYEAAFAPLIGAGYVQIVHGGADVGAYLVDHDGVDEIHITGSEKTYSTIVFGAGEAGEERRKHNEPIMTKPITGELGGVSPTIVIPGPWSDADIQFQAAHILTQKHHNAGFNCVATQVLVLPAEWERTPDLLETIRKTVEGLPYRYPFYPGAMESHQRLMTHYPKPERLDNGQVSLPRLLITDLDYTNADEYCFQNEFFNNALAVTNLPGKSAVKYLREAVQFANNYLHGTLGANIIIHPQTIKELGATFEDAIAELRYGAIGVNAWTGAVYQLSQCSWGAYPGHTPDNIGSGVGIVHNTYLFDKPQKSVAYQPFYPMPRAWLNGEYHFAPKPGWFVTNRQTHNIGRRFTYYEANRGFRHLPGLLFDALRG